ncbi:hypothetical protein ACFOWA_11705 [Pedobacter lithocola]|uniref:Uncharacterized protein n=1 Tax=Pedobacter lithocola TaxID=1908239 RepID=A0ABV8P9H3_9SPHI
MKAIEKDFSSSIHQNFDSVQQSLTELFHRVAIASENNDYQSLLNSNAWEKNYHKLTKEELFLMNLNDKEILAILNLSIYQSITQNDYSHLLNGIFTYSRLRLLNRVYVSGNTNWTVIESLVTNDKELKNAAFPKSLPFNIDTTYDTVIQLTENLLKTILGKSDFKNQSHKQYSELIGEVSSKFDNALLKYLYGLTADDYELCKTSFEQMEQLYSRCLWLTSGWYREANLNKKIPIFLLGLYQLKNFTATNFDLVIKNEFLKKANRFIVENPNYKPKLFRQFNSELKFLNEILTNNFASFYVNYKTKMNEIKNYR